MTNMEETLNKLVEYVSTYGLDVLASIFIFFIGKWVAGVLADVFEKLLLKAKTEATLCKFGKNIAYMGLMTFVILAVLGRLGIQTASFIAVLGAAGLAVGMALQGSLSNFAAGVMILVFRPYKVGDFIQTGGTSGTVEELQIFNTILNTPDNVRVIVPNAQITGGTITNYSANPTRRVDLVIGISYGDDIRKAKALLQRVVTSYPSVLKDPAPQVAVSALADSSVNFAVRPWVKSSDYWSVYFGLTETIKLELEANGFTIPFPQRDIHVHALPPQLSGAGKQAVTTA